MKATRKLIPAIAMLLVSAVLMSTASFAWFSMNREVSAQGMSLESVTPTNLLISNDGSAWGGSTTITETHTGKLLPASSSDGKLFNAIANSQFIGATGQGGQAVPGETILLTTANVTAMSGASNGWYAEYPLYIKLGTESENTVKVYLKTLTVTSPVGYKAVAANVLRVGDTFAEGVFGGETYYVANEGTEKATGAAVAATTYYTGTEGSRTPVMPVVASTLRAGESVTTYFTTSAMTVAATGTAVADTTYYKSGTSDITDCVRVSIYNGATKIGIYSTDAANVLPLNSVAISDANHVFQSTDLAAADPKDTLGDTGPKFTVTTTATALTVRVWVEGENVKCVNSIAGDMLNVSLEFGCVEE